ncbi:hypothetical protein ABZ570_32630 [Micromonospora sp. NPDC007271]|uniref:hypothetical protein n=1 Tax=Micromonospora sp. NPDC007271 TaxID=3154587 RepID=UPI0033E442AC
MRLLEDLAVEAAALTPHINALKTGTPHEGHDGWGMNSRGPGRYQCACGESIDDLLGLPPARTFYLAHCTVCIGPVPFDTAEARDEWAGLHGPTTGHRITRYETLR